MDPGKRAFIELAIQYGVLRFGEFTLKSGRVSPYFFNAGHFDSGAALAALGRHYARTIVASGIEFDLLFGPAYKGIPLAAVTAAALAEHHERDVPYAYNRKEAKTHGEGGATVGAPIEGKVLIIDDVITAGTAIREAAGIIANAQAKVAGVVIALDRCERGRGEASAVEDVERSLGTRVASIVRLEDLLAWLENDPNYGQYLDRVRIYRERYGL